MLSMSWKGGSMNFEEAVREIFKEELKPILEALKVISEKAEPETGKPSELLGVEQVANQCKVAAPTVRCWIQSGRLRACKVGRRYLVDQSTLKRFLLGMENKNKQPTEASQLARILAAERRGPNGSL